MKNRFIRPRAFFSLLTLTAILTCSQIASAQITVAKWTFDSLTLSLANTNSPSDGRATNIAAEVGSGTASGFHTTTTTTYSTPSGNGSLKSLSANNWSANDYYQFAVSTIGYSNISLSFDQQASNTGPGRYFLAYSADGINFTQFGDIYNVTNGSWNATTATTIPTSYTFDLSSVTALNNVNTVYFRLVQANTISVTGATVASTGTCRVDNFAVLSSVPGAATISTDVTNKTIFLGDTLNLSVGATGDAPLTYQWYYPNLGSPLVDGSSGFGSGVISGATNSSLTITFMDTNQAGAYRVIVSNPSSSATSAVAQVTVNVRPTVVTNIAYLHTLHNANYVLTNFSTLFQVEGVVTTTGNLITGNPANSFFIQDSTGGMDVFYRAGPSVPAAGDLVRITAQLLQFNGLLEMALTNANPVHKMEILSSGNPLPTPKFFDFAFLTNALAMEHTNEGSLVIVSNVYLTLTNANGLMSPGGPIFMTNLAGQSFTLLVPDNALSDPVGNPLPGNPSGPPYTIFASSVKGVISQSDGSAAPTNNYRMYLSLRSDIEVGSAPSTSSLQISQAGANVVLTWSDSTFALQAAPLVTGSYTNISGATSPYTNAISGSQQYYRLFK